jgi:hypothetical protein
VAEQFAEKLAFDLKGRGFQPLRAASAYMNFWLTFSTACV